STTGRDSGARSRRKCGSSGRGTCGAVGRSPDLTDPSGAERKRGYALRVGRNHWPIRQYRRRIATWALPMLVAWMGCATLQDRGRTLVPTHNPVRTGSFLLFSNVPMAEDAPAVRCLQALERDLTQHLAFSPPVGDDPVEIYVLDDHDAFAHFLRFYY